LIALDSNKKIKVKIVPERSEGGEATTSADYWEIKDIVKLSPSGSDQFVYTIRGIFDDRIQTVPGSYSGSLSIRLEYHAHSP
jgi:hypothetical protein